jgi:OOP family OmpA-OmpF porin
VTVRRVAALVVVVAVAGCGRSAVIQGRLDGIAETLRTAEAQGARVCAPRELALAEAHLDFATRELAQGNPDRAEEHARLARPNARAAVRLSPPERCSDAPPPPPEPGDRDGDGIVDPDDGCPDEAEDLDGVEDEDGCPEAEDRDADGLRDARDLCPLEAEDVDGYLDQDGCPEADDDLDGLLDAADRCPRDPEDREGFQDDDGCPDPDNDGDGIPDVADACPNEPGPADEQGCPRVYEDVEVTSRGIVIRQRIFFELDRAVLQPRSYPILDTVAQVLRDFPDMTVEIQGHTDDRGSDEYNLRLSQARAEAVREHLITRGGIEPGRLTARGYGEERPIDSNRTRRGQANNRRVEFVRTDADATPASPP